MSYHNSVYVCIYIYIYIERERDRERESSIEYACRRVRTASTPACASRALLGGANHVFD